MIPPTSKSSPAARLELAAAPAGAVTVTQLTTMIRTALQRHLPQRLVVVGELSNVARPSSGHLYFTLKDFPQVSVPLDLDPNPAGRGGH